MKIIIEQKPEYDIIFIKWLVKEIKSMLFAEVNIKLLDALNEKLNLIDVEIDLQKAFIQIVNNISYSKNKLSYHIFINPNKLVVGTPYKCIDIAKLINYGTIEILGYGIFSKVFNDVAINIDYYLMKHSMGIGGK